MRVRPKPREEGEAGRGAVGGLSVLFSLGSTKRFLFRRHVPSSPDGPIPSRNVALPGAERLVFYRNAELLHVDRTERTFASFTYE